MGGERAIGPWSLSPHGEGGPYRGTVLIRCIGGVDRRSNRQAIMMSARLFLSEDVTEAPCASAIQDRLNGQNFKSSTVCSKAARGGRSVTTFFTRKFVN